MSNFITCSTAGYQATHSFHNFHSLFNNPIQHIVQIWYDYISLYEWKLSFHLHFWHITAEMIWMCVFVVCKLIELLCWYMMYIMTLMKWNNQMRHYSTGACEQRGFVLTSEVRSLSNALLIAHRWSLAAKVPLILLQAKRRTHAHTRTHTHTHTHTRRGSTRLWMQMHKQRILNHQTEYLWEWMFCMTLIQNWTTSNDAGDPIWG